MKKKYIILVSIVLVSILAFLLWYFNLDRPIIYTFQDQPLNEATIEHEYGDELDLSPSSLSLSAVKPIPFQGNKECDIVYQEVDITELETYDMIYSVLDEEEVFTLHIHVVDTTAPMITGEVNYKIVEGSKFDISSLKLEVEDNYDDNLVEHLQMESVDTSKPGNYDLEVSVEDSSGNHSSIMIHLTIEKKKELPKPSREIVSNPNSITVLINKKRALPSGWAPSDLVSINSNGGGSHVLRSEAASMWEMMRQAALNDGITVRVVSSYRTEAYQTNLFNKYMKKDPVKAPTYSAYPRSSEHELGLAIDVSYDWSLHYDLLNHPLGQ